MIPTLKTSGIDVSIILKDENTLIAIGRLTPSKCWRLMWWKDEDN